MSKSELNRITEHIYWLSPDPTTDRPVLGAITGQQGTLVVEAGNSPAHARLFLAQLAGVEIVPPKFLFLTHWHWDHVFGAAAIDLPTFAHLETKRIMTEMAALDWSDEALDRRVEAGLEIAFCRDMIKAELPDRTGLVIRPPDIGFSHQVELDLGGITCRLEHVGGDHSADSSIAYIPEERVVFLSDCFYYDLYHQPPRYTAQKLFPLLDRLLSYDADYYLGGHNPEPLPRAELVDYARELKAIGRTVEKFGQDRAAILADLEQQFGQAPNEDHLETVDAFLAGLSH
jgi:glyoxylase-like metal-dependent hydrolase (beta-lactamase superfamily II)